MKTLGLFSLFLIFLLFFLCAQAVYQDVQQAGAIALVANAVSLILGMLAGIAMGLLAEIGFALGKRKTEKHLIIILGGALGMLVPYVLFSGLYMLVIERLNPSDTYDIGVPFMIWFVILFFSMITAIGASEPFIKKRWLTQGEER